ncbi:hypothetical protein IV38_GL000278 [Lactobacillus selangorensis]|uniref:UPF0298 protein IV38_GL000278 n=1 Tax=Lactobacillus selangorensis TaxID=81857 RepID=A0A0R2GBB9_9LACO|nr:YlbG family protein [Lactobacillus selangorensis]KRN29394.1 hypothetical protein IV38_GL000278 [Lactobacillus selangorensis]KRN34077.1 hypothetical protein IV40_GL000391 [Lactobacillus selangorensis]
MFKMTSRQGIVVWVYSMKQIKQLRRYGMIDYVSKKMKYVYLYVDQDEIDAIMAQLEKLHFVKRVAKSHRPEINMNFTARIDQHSGLQKKGEIEDDEEDRLIRQLDHEEDDADANH